MLINELREHYRTELDIVDLPFLGYNLKDCSTFKYYLNNISKKGLKISISRKDRIADPVRNNDIIDLCLCLKPDSINNKLIDHGAIIWARSDEAGDNIFCGLCLKEFDAGIERNREKAALYQILFSIETTDVCLENLKFNTAEEMFTAIIKESASIESDMLKGISNLLTYLKNHCQFQKDKIDLFERLAMEHRKNIARIMDLYKTILGHVTWQQAGESMMAYDLLCNLIEANTSDIYKNTVPSLAVDNPLLKHIFALYKRLIVNYNNIVLLRIGYLAYTCQNEEIIY